MFGRRKSNRSQRGLISTEITHDMRVSMSIRLEHPHLSWLAVATSYLYLQLTQTYMRVRTSLGCRRGFRTVFLTVRPRLSTHLHNLGQPFIANKLNARRHSYL